MIFPPISLSYQDIGHVNTVHEHSCQGALKLAFVVALNGEALTGAGSSQQFPQTVL